MTHVYCHHSLPILLGFLHSQEAKDSAQDISYRRFSETRLGPRQAVWTLDIAPKGYLSAIKMMCLADLEFQHVEKTHTPYSEDFPYATSWSLYLCLTEDHPHLSSSLSLPAWDCVIPIWTSGFCMPAPKCIPWLSSELSGLGFQTMRPSNITPIKQNSCLMLSGWDVNYVNYPILPISRKMIGFEKSHLVEHTCMVIRSGVLAGFAASKNHLRSKWI